MPEQHVRAGMSLCTTVWSPPAPTCPLVPFPLSALHSPPSRSNNGKSVACSAKPEFLCYETTPLSVKLHVVNAASVPTKCHPRSCRAWATRRRTLPRHIICFFTRLRVWNMYCSRATSSPDCVSGICIAVVHHGTKLVILHSGNK